MTLSKEVLRLAGAALMLSTCLAEPLAAAPGFAPMHPMFGNGPRAGWGSRGIRPALRGEGDLRRARREGEGGGRFAGGAGFAVLPIVPPVEPTSAVITLPDQEPRGRTDERWVEDEPPPRAACIRPLIIDLREPPKSRQPAPRVIYGTMPPACRRS